MWLSCHSFRQKEMVHQLRRYHGIDLSVRQLKYKLKKLGLSKTNQVCDEKILDILCQERELSGSSLGYRNMWRRLRGVYGINVSRRRVEQLWRTVYPEGTEMRGTRRFKRGLYHSPGPNMYWHIDGCDKLANWGIYIHGCIDGYSRRLLWLDALVSNKNPLYAANYFLDVVSEIGGVPYKIRCDRGTENNNIYRIHTYIRDDLTSTLMERSTANQRIEQHWSVLHNAWTRWWRSFFADMEIEEIFLGTPEDKELIRFCFLDIIRAELRQKVKEWNSHRVRYNRHSRVPSGVPDILFYDPPAGAIDCIQPITQDELDEVAHLAEEPSRLDDDLLEDTYQEYMDEILLPCPTSPYEAKIIYRNLRSHFVQ